MELHHKLNFMRYVLSIHTKKQKNKKIPVLRPSIVTSPRSNCKIQHPDAHCIRYITTAMKAYGLQKRLSTKT
jgi:hypothetical protein